MSDQHSVSPQNALLGKIGKYAPPPDERRRRFDLQNLAQIALPNHRVTNCLKAIAPIRIDGRYEAGYFCEIKHSAETGKARFSNLETCKNVWVCPCCAGRIAQQRRRELTRALYQAEKRGHGVLHVTFTLRHRLGDGLKELIVTLRKAIRAVWSSAAGERLRAKYQIMGNIRALETTYSDRNGWHPHAHVLLFTQCELTEQAIEEFESLLRARWEKKLQSFGGDAEWSFGVNVKAAKSYIAEYVSKFGHLPEKNNGGVDFEVGSAPTKKAHDDGMTPFGMLEAWGNDLGDERLMNLFVEYSEAMKHERQLHWSVGLADKLGMDEPMTDDEMLITGADLPADEKTMAYITATDWRELMRRAMDVRAAILNVAEQGYDVLAALLAGYGIQAMRGDERIGSGDSASGSGTTGNSTIQGEKVEKYPRSEGIFDSASMGEKSETGNGSDQGYIFSENVLDVLSAARNTYGR